MIRSIIFGLILTFTGELLAKEGESCQPAVRRLFVNEQGRENFANGIHELRKTGALSPEAAKDLIEFSREISEGIFDPTNAQKHFGKPADQVTVGEAILFIELARTKKKVTTLLHSPPPSFPPWAYAVGRRTKQAGRYTFAALILTGAFAFVNGFGAPLWDLAVAKSRQLAFWATAPTATPLSPIDTELNTQYRTTNGTFSGTAQISGNRVTYLESMLITAQMALAKTADPEWHRIVLKDLSRVIERYQDLITPQSAEGSHARELLDYIRKTYDPEGVYLAQP